MQFTPLHEIVLSGVNVLNPVSIVLFDEYQTAMLSGELV